MHKRLTAAALGLALTLSGRATARPDVQRVNVREGCRQAVAGGYLKVYDERERLRMYIRSLGDQLAALQTSLDAARKTFAAAQKKAKETTFELDIAVKRDEAAGIVKVYEGQVAEYAALKAKAEADHTARIAEEKALRELVVRVFVFDRVGDKADGGYPVHLSYKGSCPKFRHLCPLPRKDAEDLVKIRIEGLVPEACERYAGLSNLR